MYTSENMFVMFIVFQGNLIKLLLDATVSILTPTLPLQPKLPQLTMPLALLPPMPQ